MPTLLFLKMSVLSWTPDHITISFMVMVIFYGDGDGVKGYIFWDTTSHKIYFSSDVVFDESPLIKSNIVDVEMKNEQVQHNQQI